MEPATMTTLTFFNPQPNQNFTFQPTLDGITYVAVCTYNIYSQRYYITIYDTSRNVILYQPIIGSPPDFDINLIFGYFKTSTLIYRAITGNFEVSP
jgi:hypothetical protein